LTINDKPDMNRPAPFSPIRAILRYESIVNQVMDLVRSGALRIGDKFPTERTLAEQWQVSRPVLREAFRVLESQGIVESRHGSGRYLRSERTVAIGDLRRDHLRNKREALLQIWEVRSLLEVRAAELAASAATEEQVEAIIRPIALIASLPADQSHETDMTMEIHMAIANASGNPFLAEAIHKALEEYRALNFKEAVPIDEWKDLQDEHRPIAEAIRARSPSRARKAMEMHFEGLRAALDRWSGAIN
jgi:GntR family transcriptional repressor for pyruvate dehydrogenase complex